MDHFLVYFVGSIFLLVVITVGILLIVFSKRINDSIVKAGIKMGRTTKVGRFLVKIGAQARGLSYDEIMKEEYQKKYIEEGHWGITVSMWMIRIVGIIIALTAFVWWLAVIVTGGF